MSSLRICYQTIQLGILDIHLRTLRNKQQFQDTEGVAEKLGISSALWPYFGVIWPSGIVLAHYMMEYPFENKRVLEIGCGIGLASLVLNHLHADITATDYHPEAESFLRENTRLNEDSMIPFVRTGWADQVSGLGQFDLVIGSDLLYEHEHASLLAAFIAQHSKPRCEVIIVDPGRGHHARFSKRMVKLGYTHSQSRPVTSSYLDEPFKGQILQYNCD